MHETVVKSKAIITKYYGKPAKLSYWNGCSTGGRQGLMEAQKYPDDFDGIIAGAPANYQTHLHAWDMMVARRRFARTTEHFLTAPKLAALNKAVLAQCDAIDGVKDGLLNDPRKCHFDPATLLCKSGRQGRLPDRGAGRIREAGLLAGEEEERRTDFPRQGTGQRNGLDHAALKPRAAADFLGTFQYATYQDANWDWQNFDLDRDTAAADEKFGYVNAPPDLSAFKARGGKLLMYHGWNDTAISPENTHQLLYQHGAKDRLEGRQLGSGCTWFPAWATARAARSGPVQQDGGDRALARIEHRARADRRLRTSRATTST